LRRLLGAWPRRVSAALAARGRSGEHVRSPGEGLGAQEGKKTRRRAMTKENRCPFSVMLTSRDMSRSIAFYRDKLGFKLSECWPDEKKAQYANLMLGGQSVMFGAAMNPADVGQHCAGDPLAEKWWKKQAEEYQKNQPGVGVALYVMVPSVDGYHRQVTGKGVVTATEPKTQFYGIRDFGVDDPDGYRLIFYAPVAMETCPSCGMPLTEAQPGQMYCHYCADDAGKLKPYEAVFEGTVTGFFMAHQKLPRKEAEKAAREHLKKMPAWQGRS
jgi:uncharacterized glyoxalase superfamily protein PhnB